MDWDAIANAVAYDPDEEEEEEEIEEEEEEDTGDYSEEEFDDLLATTEATDEGVGPQEPVGLLEDLNTASEDVAGGVQGFLKNLITGDKTPTGASVNPTLPRRSLNALDPLDPAARADIEQAMRDSHFPESTIKVLMKDVDTKPGRNRITELLAKPVKAPARTGKTPEQIAQERVDMVKEFPEHEGRIMSSPAAGLANLHTLLTRRALYPTVPKVGKPDTRLDREAVGARFPQLKPYLPGLTDNAISKALGEIMKQEGQGDVGFKPRKGMSLKIVQDDRFKRSGLKTGDTVCIRIP